MKITTEKFVDEDGVLCRKIISTPKWAEGTKRYREGTHISPCNLLTAPELPKHYCLEGDYTEETWKKVLPYINEAFQRFVECERELEALREKWRGEETFVFTPTK